MSTGLMQKCFVCTETLSEPKVKLLQCLHSIHSDCVDHLMAQQQTHTTESLKCGVCCTQIMLNNPQQQQQQSELCLALSVLPINPFIGLLNNNSISSSDEAAKVVLECSECDDEEHIEALFRCIDCNRLMCDGHSIFHQRGKSTKTHQVEALKKVSFEN